MPQSPLPVASVVGILLACAVVIAAMTYVAISACRRYANVLSPSNILKLYQLIKDADDLFTKLKVPYVVESGTLLGAVRHQGIIPIDDDLDIQVWQADEAALVQNVFPEFKKLGYKWWACDFGYKVAYSNRDSFPFMDIFIVHDDGVRTHTKNGSFKNCHYLLSELYPITRYKFGDTEVNGPRDPTGFLNRAYKEWQKKWIPAPSHKNILCTYPGFRPQEMLPEHFFPAQPTGPLIQNVT
jgi:lipopolysaccharide cholinephosphotransferase